ncbi:MAG: MarR family winged helix-turn-helix transcriptional regulator [Rubrivivax sp.]|nr:MarR family winged helix-turn-helix transcriptional regulator [Rubrivivax sp.]
MATSNRPVVNPGAGAALDSAGVQHLLGFRLAMVDVQARRIFQRHIGAPFKLRPVEFTLLALLLGNVAAAPKQISQTLQMPPPNVSVLLDRLAERGLVQRQRSPTDGRAWQITLTAAGSELAQRAHAISLTMESGLLAALSPGERALLQELLAKLGRGAADEAAG